MGAAGLGPAAGPGLSCPGAPAPGTVPSPWGPWQLGCGPRFPLPLTCSCSSSALTCCKASMAPWTRARRERRGDGAPAPWATPTGSPAGPPQPSGAGQGRAGVRPGLQLRLRLWGQRKEEEQGQEPRGGAGPGEACRTALGASGGPMGGLGHRGASWALEGNSQLGSGVPERAASLTVSTHPTPPSPTCHTDLDRHARDWQRACPLSTVRLEQGARQYSGRRGRNLGLPRTPVGA